MDEDRVANSAGDVYGAAVQARDIGRVDFHHSASFPKLELSITASRSTVESWNFWQDYLDQWVKAERRHLLQLSADYDWRANGRRVGLLRRRPSDRRDKETYEGQIDTYLKGASSVIRQRAWALFAKQESGAVSLEVKNPGDFHLAEVLFELDVECPVQKISPHEHAYRFWADLPRRPAPPGAVGNWRQREWLMSYPEPKSLSLSDSAPRPTDTSLKFKEFALRAGATRVLKNLRLFASDDVGEIALRCEVTAANARGRLSVEVPVRVVSSTLDASVLGIPAAPEGLPTSRELRDENRPYYYDHVD
jgi:hypothetical protein